MKFIRSTPLLFSLVIIGTYIGIYFSSLGTNFDIIANIYLSYIKLSIIPIVFTFITISSYLLFSMKSQETSRKRILGSILISVVVCASIAALMGTQMSSISTDIAKNPIVAKTINKDIENNMVEMSLTDSLEKFTNFDVTNLFTQIIPQNPFHAFANGNLLQILFFSIIIGATIAILPESKKEPLMKTLELIRDLFSRILSSSMYFLPLGLFATITSNVSKMNITVLSSMMPFCLSFLGCLLIFCMICLVLLKYYSSISLWKTIKAFKEALIIAFSTSSSQLAVPFLMKVLEKEMGFSKQQVDLVLPMSMILCRGVIAAYLSFVTILIATLYHTPLGLSHYIFIVLGTSLVSIASSGSVGIVTLSMIPIVLTPLGLPFGAIGVILIIIDPIIEPFRTVATTFLTTTIACFIMNKKHLKITTSKILER